MEKRAVIETGGKQYRIAVGDTISIEKLFKENGESYEEGDKIVFDKILLLENGEDVEVGRPYLENKKVSGVIQLCGRAKKIDVLKFKAKTNYTRRYGHRQHFFRVAIEDIK